MAAQEPWRQVWSPYLSWRIVRRACWEWWQHNGMRLASALAFYAVFTFVPLLWLAITVAGWIFQHDLVLDQVQQHFANVINREVADGIRNMLTGITNPDDPREIVLGLLLFLYAATSAFLEARTALGEIWQLPPPAAETFFIVVRNYFAGIVMVIMIAVLLTASLICHAVLHRFDLGRLDSILTFVFFTALLASMYRVLSDQRIGWGHTVYGSIICALLLLLGRGIIQGYLLTFPGLSAYGQGSLVMVLMLWVYYSAQVFYFGAELIQARRTRRDWLAETLA